MLKPLESTIRKIFPKNIFRFGRISSTNSFRSPKISPLFFVDTTRKDIQFNITKKKSNLAEKVSWIKA